MKKMIVKSTFAVVAVTVSSLGTWKAYGVYGNVDNSLLMENLEALSANSEGDNGEGKPAILEGCKSPGGGTIGTAMYICTSGTTLFYSNCLPPHSTVYPCSTRGIPKIDILSSKPNNGYCMKY